LNIKDYQKLALRTEKTPNFVRLDNSNPESTHEGHRAREKQFARLTHGLIGITTEMGESWDAVKKYLIYGKPMDTVNVVEELGDKLWYIALALDAVGATFEEAMQKNIDKLEARYQGTFTEDKALNRDLEKEREVLTSNQTT